MKKIMIPVFILLMICISILVSAGTPIKFSCNNKINSYVNRNYKKLSTIRLKLITNYKLEYQQAIYRSLVVNQKKALWQEKFAILISQANMWNKEEIQHLKEMINFINKHEFKGISYDNIQFMTDWIAFGETQFKWKRSVSIYLLSTLNSTANNKDEIEKILINEYNFKQTSSPGENYFSKCDCRVGFSGCNILHECVPDGCTLTDGGCGLLWLQNCNGSCYTGPSDTSPSN